MIPRILQLRSHWIKSEKESLRLEEAGISKEVMNSAIAQFCLEIIAKHGDPAPRLCNKDPLTLKMGSYVIELFPNVSTLHTNRITYNMSIIGFCSIGNFSYISFPFQLYRTTQKGRSFGLNFFQFINFKLKLSVSGFGLMSLGEKFLKRGGKFQNIWYAVSLRGYHLRLKTTPLTW